MNINHNIKKPKRPTKPTVPTEPVKPENILIHFRYIFRWVRYLMIMNIIHIII